MGEGVSVERTYAVMVRVEETTKEVAPGAAATWTLSSKVDRTKRDVVNIVVSAGDSETAIRKAIRLLRTELPFYAEEGHGDPE